MTPSEFKSWFEGYTEALEERPSKAQWERIKARVAEIDGKPITQTIYMDRYVPAPWRPYWPYPVYNYAASSTAISIPLQATTSGTHTHILTAGGGATTQTFDSHQAMHALGVAEANEVS
jgi:hypothetical protein